MGWNTLAFDDSSWPAAVSEGAWGNSPVWGMQPPMPPASPAQWIWWFDSRTTGDANITVYFRKVFVSPTSTLTLWMSVDDTWTVYLDGVDVQDGTLWYNTMAVQLMMTPNAPHVLAVRATNNSGAGGVVADLRANPMLCAP
jgi:hypothetical protein